MPITSGFGPAPRERPEQDPRRPRERDRARARDASPSSAEDKTQTGEAPAEVESTGEVVPFPGGQIEVAAPSALVEAAKTWWGDARQTGARAIDGSILRARPPSIRDSFVRVQRAEWSGGVPALALLGKIYGYPAQCVRAVLMVLIWLLDHPSRLLIAGGVLLAAFPFVLH